MKKILGRFIPYFTCKIWNKDTQYVVLFKHDILGIFIRTGQNGPGRARTVANRAGTAPTGAARTGPYTAATLCL